MTLLSLLPCLPVCSGSSLVTAEFYYSLGHRGSAVSKFRLKTSGGPRLNLSRPRIHAKDKEELYLYISPEPELEAKKE